MLFAAALLLAGATDGTALLEAFAAPCAHVEDFEKTKAEAAKGGWEEIAEDADPRLWHLEKLGRDAVGDDGTMFGARYRHTVGVRQVFLVVSRYEDKSGFWGNGCRVYDFDAPGAIDEAVVERWIGKPSTSGLMPVAGGTRFLWEPWVDGRTFELNYMPKDEAVAKQLGLSGVILVSQAIGGF
ncbi:MAG: hypothetical protein KF730_01485 [Sphingomonas sp.]|uniref:hypothetical protein n=1 Tax=Sphingomonas sp. TaxID=28214 RepID=UPI0025CC68B5|nr:hypothetical protein [Sphingomonas sp.]MBX3563225.1 hypothetical protein [Sphingomonas sp.]